MGRKDSSPKVTQSSIALLQERFRQLQRVKERREEREQQRASCERPAASLTAASGAARPLWFNHPELVRPTPSCWLSYHGGHWTAELQALEASLPVIGSPVAAPSEPDIDTTLHL